MTTVARPIDHDAITASLLDVEARLRALGVRRLALFGSVARNEAKPDSDVDLLLEFEPGMKSYDRFLAIAETLEELLGRRIELITKEGLSPHLGPKIEAEARDVLRAA